MSDSCAHVVNTDLLKLPEGMTEEQHVRRGEVMIAPAKLLLHLEPEQAGLGALHGEIMCARLTGRPDVLGLCELQYLREHQVLIPAVWEHPLGVTGWNTILKDEHGRRLVAYLCCDDNGWGIEFRCLDFDWFFHDPAGCLESRT